MKSILSGMLIILSATSAFAACPPTDPYALILPKDKAYAKKAFLAKAKQLNKSGQCVIEGSFGRNHNKFYYAVSPTGQASKNAKFLRFTYDELKK